VRALSVADVLGPYIAIRVRDIRRLDPLVGRSDAEAIHDMRVATRRLKSTLIVYRAAFAGGQREHLVQELDWLTGTLGQARDFEVQRLILHELADNTEAIARVEAASRLLMAEAAAALDTALGTERYHLLAASLSAFSADLPWRSPGDPADTVLRDSVRRQFKRLETRALAASVADSDLDQHLHSVRKSTKRTRYSTEALEPIIGDSATDLAGRLSAAQDVLGAHNDLVVTRGHYQVWADLGVGDGALSTLDGRVSQSRDYAQATLEGIRAIVHDGRVTLRRRASSKN